MGPASYVTMKTTNTKGWMKTMGTTLRTNTTENKLGLERTWCPSLHDVKGRKILRALPSVGLAPPLEGQWPQRQDGAQEREGKHHASHPMPRRKRQKCKAGNAKPRRQGNAEDPSACGVPTRAGAQGHGPPHTVTVGRHPAGRTARAKGPFMGV